MDSRSLSGIFSGIIGIIYEGKGSECLIVHMNTKIRVRSCLLKAQCSSIFRDFKTLLWSFSDNVRQLTVAVLHSREYHASSPTQRRTQARIVVFWHTTLFSLLQLLAAKLGALICVKISGVVI